LILSEKLIIDSNERKILKDLGSWLGIVTLARNKPILMKDLELKELIIDSFQTGRASAIVPLVTKILDHSFKTKVFHQKNPWLLAILSLLHEIHNI
jgi:CCR4-NOT transcription complex subunit 1